LPSKSRKPCPAEPAESICVQKFPKLASYRSDVEKGAAASMEIETRKTSILPSFFMRVPLYIIKYLLHSTPVNTACPEN
jgi:hypothetical protein